MCAIRLISRGYESYLTYICDTRVESPSLYSILVVYEFSNVFPTNLLGIPPVCEIDFAIDLELGTQPISMVAYRMASTKIKELNS